MPKKLLIITDDAGESFEILYAQHRFREEGWIPVIASSQKKTLNSVIHDFCPGWTTYVEKPGYLIASDVAISKVRSRDFAAILLIGGRAPEHLRHDRKLLELVKEFHAAGKWIFSICHGIQIVLAAGLANGRKLTCYRNIRCEVEQCGGEWVDRECVRDDKLITSQTWESHPDFYREIFRALRAS